MFERLAGKVLSRLLSKYFISDDSTSSTSTSAPSAGSNINQNSWTNLGVWSGYVSLEQLEFKKELLNEYFRARGIPVDVLSCTIKRVEITVPWAKLHDPNEVVVVVLDGVHLLMRAHLHRHDDRAVRNHMIQQRKQALAESELFGKEVAESSYTEMFKKKATEGIIKDILDKLHIHIRNVHVRVEDVDTPSPFAIGLTLESLHIHHDNSTASNTDDPEDDNFNYSKTVVRKVAQLNHLAIYWNAVADSRHTKGMIPVELSMLVWMEQSQQIAKALDQCIARRASPLASSSQSASPKHVYLLLPVDATAHVTLSRTPNDLSMRPAVVLTLQIDDVSVQIRDFQLSHIMALKSSLQEHFFVQQYRPYFRPKLSALVDPKAWWEYAVHIIRMELRKSRMRWSWSRFHQRYEQRRRYCELFERQQRSRRQQVAANGTNISPHKVLITAVQEDENENGTIFNVTHEAIMPDTTEGDTVCDSPMRSSSTDSLNRMPLSPNEINELAEIEDGLRGDLAVYDIVLFRALIKARLATIAASEHGRQKLKRKSRLRRLVSSVINDDIESEEEYEHLLAYLENANKELDSQCEDLNLRSLVAISIQANLEHGCISLFSPLPSTADLNQHRRIHERFLDLSISHLYVGYSLLANFEAFELQSSLDILSVKEVRSDKREYTVISRLCDLAQAEAIQSPDNDKRHLVFVQLISDPPDHPEYDIGVHAQIDSLLISLSPSCEWIHHVRGLFNISMSDTSKKMFWEGLRMAQSSSSDSRRAEFLTMIDAALKKHKNLDLDIQIKMPTIAINDSDDRFFSIYLGDASIATDRLAGMSTGKLNFSSLHEIRRKSSLDQNGHRIRDENGNRASTPVEDDRSGSLTEPLSPRLVPRMDALNLRGSSSPISRGLDAIVLGRSSSSVLDDKRQFGRSRSLSITENMFVSTIDQTDDMTYESTVNSVQSPFYDIFIVRLSKPRISMKHYGESEVSDFLTQFEIKIIFEISVLPSDHTLCRLIANCVIEEIGVSCSASDVENMLFIFRSWQLALSSFRQESLSTLSAENKVKDDIRTRLSPFLNSTSTAETPENSSDSSSVLDEAEFIDAMDGGDSEGNNDWFDENFVVDTESTVASESQSIPLSARRLRRPRSMSDTSSISELSVVQPQRKMQRNDGAYLSAENLAKLDENGREDHSDTESEGSYHSAVVSLQDHQELLDAIKHDIDRVTDQIWKLNRKLVECNISPDAELDYVSTSTESSKRRLLRKSIKLDMSRAEAELKALHATRLDLLNSLPDYSDSVSRQDSTTMAPSVPFRQQRKDRVIERANLVLRSRRKRVSIMESDGLVHSLTNMLNREIFRGSFQVKRFSFQLSRLSSILDQSVTLDTTMSKLSIATTHQSNDTKVFASIDGIQVRSWIDSFAERNVVFTGGDDYTLAHTMLPAEFPQLISSSTSDEKFMRFALHAKGKNSGGKISKVRLLIGGVEIVPRAEVTSALLILKSIVSGPREENTGIDLDSELQGFCLKLLGKHPVGMQTHGMDFIMRFSSVRCRFVQGGHTIGAFSASEVGVRVARSMKHVSLSSKCQVDLRCTNMQVLEVKSTDSSHAVEILGRRDPFGHLLFTRIRMQTVSSEVVSGWVVGGREEDMMPVSKSCINCHVGIRCNALQVVASLAAFAAMKDTLVDHSCMHEGATPMRSNLARNAKEYTGATPPFVSPSLRWRSDFSAASVAIVVPGKSYNQLVFPGSIDGNVLLSLSVQACAQRDSTYSKGVDIHFTTDVSVTRTADDWPIIEKTTLHASLYVPNILRGDAIAPYQLMFPDDSSWVQEKCSTLLNSAIVNDEARAQGVICFMPLRMNISSQICSLLILSYEGLKNNRGTGSSRNPRRTKPMISEFEGRIVFDLVEARLMKQSQNNSNISLADRISSIQLKKCSFLANVRDDEAIAHFDVSQTTVCDLSSLPGVRIVGSSPLGDEGEIDFLRISIGVSNPVSGPAMLQVNVRWGDVQIIPIPTFIKSLLQFKTELDEFLGFNSISDTSKSRAGASFLSQDIFIVFSLEIRNFELVLSSRSILAYLRDKSKNPINVVSFRWASSTKGFLLLKHALPEVRPAIPASSLVDIDDLLTKATNDFKTLGDFGERCLNRFTIPSLVLGSANALYSSCEWQAFTIRVNLAVTGFQALRTTIQQAQEAFKNTERGTPHKLIVQPPIYGEQRITNQINFRTRYRLSGTGFGSQRTDATSAQSHRSLTSIAQAVHFDAGFVDVLVYIRQSAGGLNDAYRETIQPIQALLKTSKHDGVSVSSERKESAFADLLRKATTVFSTKLEGFQVTCVPGGATRLTESPIIKAALSNLRLSLALLFVPRQVDEITNGSSTFGIIRGSEDLAPGSFTASGCTSGELSAHYHNRRLVAWEPVVEPWTVHVQFGADLNRLFGQPIARSIWRIEKKPLTSTERLRDIGLRWVSKFSPDPKNQSPNNRSASSTGNHMLDMPYILLTSLGWDIIEKALYVSFPVGHESPKRMLPPSDNPREWLELFGLPSPPETDNTSQILCSMSDTKPLNINVTGALIENLSTYLGLTGTERVRSTVPHWIRNETGLTIRFQEMLALDRQRIGERATKTILASGREIPLSLKRTLSQSCDPHRATIRIELGKYDETHGRVTGIIHDDMGSTNPNTYCYRTTIAVDTVGVKKVPLLPNASVIFSEMASAYCSKLYIIARVSLKGDNKVVSLESPLLVKNTSEVGLTFEINGSSLLWSSGPVPASQQIGREHTTSVIPIPADILPLLDTRAAALKVSSALDDAIPSLVTTPPAFSEKSLSKGKITEEEVCLAGLSNDCIHACLNVCGLRIGSVDLNSDFSSDAKANTIKLDTDPQQRMILFRPAVVIHNQLPTTVVMWIRPKRVDQSIPRTRSTNLLAAFAKREKILYEKDDVNDDKYGWFNVGIVQSGGSISWSGAPSDAQIELKVQIVENDGEECRQFPCVSSIATIIATSELLVSGSSIATTRLRIADSFKTTLSLTTTVKVSNNFDVNASTARDFTSFVSKLTRSPREVSISVPYWIVDSSGLELEYAINTSLMSTHFVAGQRGPLDSKGGTGTTRAFVPASLGLAELIGKGDVTNSTPASSFVVLMIGDRGKPKLKIRRKPTHNLDDDNGDEIPWSKSIELGSAYSDINLTTLTLRSQTISAPTRFGEKNGTKIIHIFSKIEIVNELARDIEIVMCRGKEWPTLVPGDGQPTPFHCNKEGKIRFRPTEFGWKWSGALELREDRKDVTLRLVHKLRGQVVLVTVDFFIGRKSVGDRVIFRAASHPPFRIENHTMHALRYFQGYSADIGISSHESTLLAFQSVDFAWDEPDADSSRCETAESSLLFTLEVVDLQFSAEEAQGYSRVLGRLELDSIAPGTNIHFSRFSHLPEVAGTVVADGPTKVLHIINTSLPLMEGDDAVNAPELELGALLHLDKATSLPCWINVQMNHGIGISIVDWTPQELVYIRFDDIRFDRSISFTHESISFSVGRVSIDNQLWVTPYPVLLHIDKRTGRRLHHAVLVSTRRALKDQGGLAMIDKLEIAVEPISLQVDGYLVALLENAYRTATQTILKVELNEAHPIPSLEEEIRSLLALREPQKEVKELKPYASVLSENFVESRAWAAKCTGKVRLGSSVHYRVTDAPERKLAAPQATSKARRRAYINKTDVSALKAEISWAGPLPLPQNLSNLSRSLLSSVRSVLTFESVPVSIGAFSSDHTYSDDIADSLKNYYKSYLRPGAILGMLAALPFRAPVSVVKAIIYTSNQFYAEFLDSLAEWNNSRAFDCLRLTPRELLPSFVSKLSTECILGASWPYMITVGRISLGLSKFFHFWMTIFSTRASKHRYAGIRNAGDQLAIRRRNPRLFAHINGQDLLVEYVEGASAGKALLSRVRRGQHLGEGYVYHTVDAMLGKESPDATETLSPGHSRTFILMVSIERILVVSGDRGVNFCEVLWEVTFSNVVHVEVQECVNPTLDMLKIWHLTDTAHSTGNREDLLERIGNIMTNDIGFGLAVLCCKTLFVPHESQLRSKMAPFLK